MNIAGGTHHAFRDRAEAFCMLNDQAIGANFLLENNLASKILIIDLDVHQGNGTASIFNLDNRVFTISFHGKKNYPFHKEKSDIDVEFDDGTGDIEYLKKMDAVIPKIIDEFQPNFIFKYSISPVPSSNSTSISLFSLWKG
jgi:acetoin utilization deacetylase AcuC-like enzyme